MINPRRTAMLRISGELFLDLFKKGNHPEYDCLRGFLPEDSMIIGVRWDAEHNVVHFTIHSKTFQKVRPGERLPDITPVFSRPPVPKTLLGRLAREIKKSMNKKEGA